MKKIVKKFPTNKTHPCVCHYFRYFNPQSLGGVETHIQTLSQSLSKEFNFTILCDQETRLPEDETTPFAHIHRIPPIKSHETFFDKIKSNILDEFTRENLKTIYLESHPPDILHVHGPVGFSGTVAAGSLLSPFYHHQSWVSFKGPKLMTFHGLPSIVLSQKPGASSKFLARAWKKVEEKNVHDSDRIICVDRYVLEDLKIRNLAEKCIFIPNGIDFSRFKPQPKSIVQKKFQQSFCLDLSVFQTVYLFLNRLSFEKGIHRILELEQLPPNTLMLIAGDGPYRKEVEEKCRIHPQFHYLGNVPNELTPIVFNSVDYLVSPLYHPAATRTHLEALACHLPVISFSQFDHYPLQHEKNGLLLDPQKPLQDSFHQFDQSYSFSSKGLREFDLRVTSKKVAALYRELLE